ncbi:Warthog protein 6 [Amphibalanus amphitrite]|uniref:Warthog protein 6 n=1 Tax=Amphibalanus amphitrite TaxID=1232801 RepID=A0A6A4WUG1_AMPAM|nr:Warthog protein 6 [Amphibalanus amphitrite]
MLFVFAALLAVAVADSRPAYQPAYRPAYQPAYQPAYKPAYKPKGYGHHDDYSEPRPYQFGYAVNDHYHGAVFSQNEQADAYGNVEGYYSVNLPDGRVQHVKYVANDYGNNAEVTYEGEAQYPQYKPAYQPAYKPAYPVHPAPAYQPAYKPAY